MRCEDAAEFVSALCDGERIPREVAEHIGTCEMCRARLQDYALMGAELRRSASLDPAENVPAIEYLLDSERLKQKRRFMSWWKKGGEAMRIPRFAFVLMVLVIVGLSSGLAAVRARSNGQDAQEPVLVVSLKVPNAAGKMQCALFTNGSRKSNSCAAIMGTKDGGELEASVRFLAKQGDQITLGVQTQFIPPPVPYALVNELDGVPVEQYELAPGKTVNVEIAGLGTAELTGEPLDHMPPLFFPTETLDPGQDELRLISPLLLRGRQVAFDQEGGSALGTGKDGAVWIYAPGVGRLIVSTDNFAGAVEGQVKGSRIDFEIDGQQYDLLAGAPITRTQSVWVRLNPNFEPPDSMRRGAIGWATLKQLLSEQN